jgi:hypothetical protein
MARRHWVEISGRKFYVPTRAEAVATAERAANRLRRAVLVGYDQVKKKPRRAAPIGDYRRNPMMGGHDFTGEVWKISCSGPRGVPGAAYANSEAEARDTVRILRARGCRVTHVVRLKAPNAPKKRSTARK